MEGAQVISCSKVITLHLLQSRQPTNVYNPHKGIVNCVHINHTNKVIASCGQDGRIVLVNAQKPDNQVFQTSFNSNSTVSKPVSVNCIMFSPNSHYIAAGGSDCLVKIWDMKNHKHVYSTIKSHVGPVTSIAWIKNCGIQSAQGQILASSSSIGDIFLNSVKTSNLVQTLNTKNQQGINQIKVSESQGHCRLAACTANGSIIVWNIKNIEKDTNPQCYFNNMKKSSMTSISFSSFNPVLLAASSVDQTLTFYDVNQKKSVKSITCQQPLTSINFHNDGHTLLTGGMYGGLFVYDLRKPTKPKQKLTGHDSAIKHSIFIKQYEPSSNMAASRASKTSSVNSINSSKANSTKQFKQVEEVNQNKQVKLNNFVQNNLKQQIKQKTINSRNKSQSIQNKNQNIKLSATSQQILKNNENKQQISKLSNVSSSTYNYYNKPSQNSSKNGPQKSPQLSVPKNSVTQSNNYNINSNTNQLQKINQQQSQSKNLPTVSTNLNHANRQPDSNLSQIKELIQDKFQALHMELINQFYIQQKQMKDMIVTLLVQDKKKNQKIKQLEVQVKKLKENTY